MGNSLWGGDDPSINIPMTMRMSEITSPIKRITFVIFLGCLLIIKGPAWALDIDAQRNLVNQGVIGILTDGVRGSQIELMADLATVLDDGYRMRIIPMAGKGSVRAVEDLLLMRGVDVALVQADVLEFYREADLFPDIDKRLRYLARLHNEEVHILASKDIPSIRNLLGRKVNFGPPSSGSYVTASLLFQRLGIKVTPLEEDYQIALDMLRQGEIDAWVRVGAKPLLQIENIPDWEALHFLSIPSSSKSDVHVAGKLTSEDYPNLIAEGTALETIAVPSIMAVYNWSGKNEKRKQLSAFADRFVENFERLKGSAFHPKWREVDLERDIPGWQRF